MKIYPLYKAYYESVMDLLEYWEVHNIICTFNKDTCQLVMSQFAQHAFTHDYSKYRCALDIAGVFMMTDKSRSRLELITSESMTIN